MTSDPVFVITEGITGTWFYHWSWSDKKTQALCGAQVMPSNLGTDAAWGYRGHLKERYCVTCEELRKTFLRAHNE